MWKQGFIVLFLDIALAVVATGITPVEAGSSGYAMPPRAQAGCSGGGGGGC